MDLQRVRNDARKIIEREPELSNPVLLFLEIFNAQVSMYEILASYMAVDDLVRYFNRAKSIGSSLFDVYGTPEMNPQVWRELTFTIIRALAPHRKDLEDEINTIIDSLENDLFDPESLAKLSFKGDLNYARGASLTTGVSEDLLSALGVWVIQSLLMTMKEILNGRIDSNGWNRGFCPICGSYTRTSFVNEEGVHLKCEICGMEWNYPEGKCPFCESQEVRSSELGEGFYSLECDECKSSWKLVDERIFGKEVSRELYPIILLKFETAPT